MDESDAGGEPVVTATGGVTLQKRLETGKFQQPTVLYELESQRDTTVDVRVIEPIPSALEPDDLGFLGAPADHPWEINGPKIVFDRTLEPGGTYRTGVAARGDRAGAITDLLDAPEFVDIEDVEDTRATDVEDGAAESTPPAVTDPAGPLIERLVAELREGTAPPETVAALRTELGTAANNRPSLETRLAQLQADVADVRAYTNAMEGFLDEHGPADEVIEDLEGRLDRLDERLASLENRVEARDETTTAVEGHLADVEEDLDALEDRLPGDNVDERLEAVESELASVSEFTTSLKAAFQQ